VERFIRLISDNGPDAESLRFFQAICSCRGVQILSNQELCLEKFYQNSEKRRELVIQTCAISPGNSPNQPQNNKQTKTHDFKLGWWEGG
jgi:hypothetical protein